MPNMYGTVAVVRDQPKSASMGRRNRLNEFMLIDVMVTTPAQRSSTMLRESGMARAADLVSYARSTRKSPQNGTKNFCPEPGTTRISHHEAMHELALACRESKHNHAGRTYVMLSVRRNMRFSHGEKADSSAEFILSVTKGLRMTF
jgi:hypothetical protein